MQTSEAGEEIKTTRAIMEEVTIKITEEEATTTIATFKIATTTMVEATRTTITMQIALEAVIATITTTKTSQVAGIK